MSEKVDWLGLLQDSKINEFNEWRMANIFDKIDLSGKDFSGKDLSNAYLNGIKCNGTNLSNCNLQRAEFCSI